MNNLFGWVNKYVGIPYKSKGTSINEGLDCLSLVELIYKEKFNIHLPFNEHLETENNLETVGCAISKEKQKWIKLDGPENFCVVLLKICNFPVHMGIVLDDNHMLHSLKGHNSAIERFDSFKWKNRIDGFYRYKELT